MCGRAPAANGRCAICRWQRAGRFRFRTRTARRCGRAAVRRATPPPMAASTGACSTPVEESPDLAPEALDVDEERVVPFDALERREACGDARRFHRLRQR